MTTKESLEKWCIRNNMQYLLKEWNHIKNNPLNLTLNNMSHGSNIKVWWICHRNHEWQATIYSRTNRKTGCPYCSGRMAIKGVNDIATTAPEIAKQWHHAKNGKLSPSDVTIGSNKKVWWLCERNHEWESKIKDRKNGDCPICSGHQLLVGYNDLATTHPHLAKEWHPIKNNNLKPEDVVSNGKKKVWWLCAQGHEYQMLIIHRKRGLGCPICSGKEVLVGFNDLYTKYPQLAKQWHPTKNGDLKPTDVAAHSNKSVWWMCEYGHEWKTNIGNRTKPQNTNCPYCSSQGMSKPEITLWYYIKKYANSEVYHRYNNFGFELDIYIPSIKTAIEYDGRYYHKDRIKEDIKKNELCKELGIQLYRVRENGLSKLNNSSIDLFYNIYDTDEFENVIKTIVLNLFQKHISIDIKKDSEIINSLISTKRTINSIVVTHPHIAKEWNRIKNKNLIPEHVTAGSSKLVWWICQNNHEWKAKVSDRTRQSSKCPICSGKRILVGFNDLATTHPEIAKQWHPIKNSTLKPTSVTHGSGKKAWWICDCGHEWESKIYARTNGSQCPCCASKKC